MKKLLVKSQVAAFTRKDGVMVQAHDSGKQASAPAFSSSPRPHGGFKVSGPDHEATFRDQPSADAHAKNMSAVHADGRGEELKSLAPKLAKKHAGFDTLEPANRDHEDFKETSRQGAHAMIHEAYQAGRKKKVDPTHKGAAAAMAGAAKHLPHESLHPTNSGEDFKETAKWSVSSAIHHAFAAGHADKEKAKASAMPKQADPEASRAAGAHVRAVNGNPMPGDEKYTSPKPKTKLMVKKT